MTIQQFQQEKSIPEYVVVCNAMAQCFSNITECNDAKVQYSMSTNEIEVVFTNKKQEIVRMPINQLGDGYRSAMYLFADIAYRMAILNPQYLDKVLEETEGIVLIDEIELHLSPVLQQRIIGDLLEIFPKVQFIVSTHATDVVNSVQSDSLIVLKEN